MNTYFVLVTTLAGPPASDEEDLSDGEESDDTDIGDLVNDEEELVPETCEAPAEDDYKNENLPETCENPVADDYKDENNSEDGEDSQVMMIL